MRLSRLSLSWFRGASQGVELDCEGKSVVVYGANGAGKSSFADAIEFVVGNGRIAHLSHEYSGPRQEKGIRNTHCPDTELSRVRIHLADGALIDARIDLAGALCLEETPQGLIADVQSWDLERLVLRQDELARFIHSTKAEKYSVLLPLIGLAPLEHAAQNLRQLQGTLEKRGNLQGLKQGLDDLRKEVLRHLPEVSLARAEEALAPLAARYIEGEAPSDLEGLLRQLEGTIGDRVSTSEPEQHKHFALQQIADEGLDDKLELARRADREAARVVGELVDRQIAVLEETAEYLGVAQPGAERVNCPACGRPIGLVGFREHVEQELGGLQQARETRRVASKAKASLAGSLARVLKNAAGDDLADWLEKPRQADIRAAVRELANLALPSPADKWDKNTWSILRLQVPAVTVGVTKATRRAPPSSKQLIEDSGIVDACRVVLRVQELTGQLSRIEALLGALAEAEQRVRNQIRERTEAVLGSTSQLIQRLWGELHPDEPIEGVRLCIPEDSDKAIDVALRFFGVEQPSPRLTLSEGHRNSLGLCIFLALVLQEGSHDRPVVLDDVVSSFDREHRGMLADLLLRELSDRQVMLLTHDREWYSELRWRLPASRWVFKTLRPWEGPVVGIRWAQSEYTFDDARAIAPSNPEAAGNRARSIMDTELAIIAEKLQVSAPYVRGDRNDQRTCIDFLERIIKEARGNLKRLESGAYVPFAEPIAEWERSHALLGAWANRASHTGSLTKQEADTLIDACESAIARFRCVNCGEPIWIADQEKRERVQCACGTICWRYG